MRQDTRRVVIHDFDVGDERRARKEPFEKIVGQHGVLGDPAIEHRRERGHIVQSLARVDAFREEVLVGVRDGRGVGVKTGIA
jgi:hypothetical protein